MNTQLNLPAEAPLDAYSLLESFDRAMNASLLPKFETLAGKQVVFSPDDKQYVPLEGWEPRNSRKSIDIHALNPVHEPAYIAAVDSSCILVGDTDEGSIYAAKGGMALSFARRPVMHFRIGPIIFYVNHEQYDDPARPSAHGGHNDFLAKFSALDASIAKRIIRTRVERLMQKEISKYLHGSIILVDGSLKSSVFEDRENELRQVARNCRTNSSLLIGISKTTKLKVLDQMASLLMERNDACYVDVEPVVRLIVSRMMGKPLLAKLSGDGLVLRIDVLSGVRESLGRLLENDVMVSGYPETLRLAHHLSIFTKTDVLSIRGFILGRLNTREIASEDVRRRLLGSLCVGGL